LKSQKVHSPIDFAKAYDEEKELREEISSKYSEILKS